jgi:hypothetical protein
MPGNRVKLDTDTNSNLEYDNNVNYIPLLIVLFIIIVVIYLIYRLFNKVNQLSNTITEMSDTIDKWVNFDQNEDFLLNNTAVGETKTLVPGPATLSTSENSKPGTSGVIKDKVDKNLKTPVDKTKLNESKLESIDENVKE